jgi:hypothetical protein
MNLNDTSQRSFYAGVEYLKEKNPKKIKNMRKCSFKCLEFFEDDGCFVEFDLLGSELVGGKANKYKKDINDVQHDGCLRRMKQIRSSNAQFKQLATAKKCDQGRKEIQH